MGKASTGRKGLWFKNYLMDDRSSKGTARPPRYRQALEHHIGSSLYDGQDPLCLDIPARLRY